ncbi:MAG TPA: hypothetical protein DEQ77_10555, partial [Candidatus Omnitrophica bacterium]|nr:hypothetical protein [Candidatus Omnitrophota bacterium]
MREKIVDMLGFLRIYAIHKGDSRAQEEINTVIQDIFSSLRISYQDFANFIISSRDRLREALSGTVLGRVVFVMGHKNPDTDTVISSLFEAYRNHLVNPGIVYIPVVQGARIPDEVSLLLNNPCLSDAILLSDEDIYARARASGQANWILVDHNVSDIQKFVISIIDHHSPSGESLRQDAAKVIEIMGSTTALVALRFYGLCLDMTGMLARICYGAALMDTENKSRSKMTLKDEWIMNRLSESAGININESNAFYQNLMSALLNTDDAELLFGRDYKADWGFGFAVAKMKGVFARDRDEVLKKNILKRLTGIARENNRKNDLPLTLVKVVDYENDNETVFKERMYFIFKQGVEDEFRNITRGIFKAILNNQYARSRLAAAEDEEFIEYGGVGGQLSRKKIAPILELVVSAFNKYFYSEKLKLYVSRDFLKVSDYLKNKATGLGIELSVNEEGYINYMSPCDLMRLVKSLDATMLSLKEYALVREEAKSRGDIRMLQGLEYHGFVEVLGTVVLEYDADGQRGSIIEHPAVMINNLGCYEIKGQGKQARIPLARPGVFDWDKVDPETGLPLEVFNPAKSVYNGKALSRYWSPYEDRVCVFVRGSIFLLGITCMDGKVKFNERQKNMGVRLCRSNVEHPKVLVSVEAEDIIVKIESEEGISEYRNGLLKQKVDMAVNVSCIGSPLEEKAGSALNTDRAGALRLMSDTSFDLRRLAEYVAKAINKKGIGYRQAITLTGLADEFKRQFKRCLPYPAREYRGQALKPEDAGNLFGSTVNEKTKPFRFTRLIVSSALSRVVVSDASSPILDDD